MLVSPTYAKTNTLQSILTGDSPNCFTTTTGTLTLGGSGRINFGRSRLYTLGSDLLHTAASTAVNLFNIRRPELLH